MKVLLADDDRVFVEHVSTRLREKGHTVTVAVDAMQAFMFAMKNLPDVILLDINMPGGTGSDVLKKLKMSGKTSHIPVVVVSSDQDPALDARVTKLGASRFLRKPLRFDALYEALGRSLPEADRPPR